MKPGDLSFWLHAIEDELTFHPPLDGDDRCDVAIVGAGYAGLWTAYYLRTLDPSLDVAVIEAEFAGRGAAGRNGGWCSLDMSNFAGLLGNAETQSRAVTLMGQLIDTVYVVRDAVADERIACDFHLGGAAHVAISEAQLARARAGLSLIERNGLGNAMHWVDAEKMRGHVNVEGCLGGVFTPHCAVVQPARLARGLADAVVRKGVRLFEHSPVTEVVPGGVTTPRGTMRAAAVILATEGYTAGAPGLPGRRLYPMHSFMTVTEPLDDAAFAQIGLHDRPAFGDYSWLVTYGQRTADNRLAFGYGGGSFLDGVPRDVFRAAGRRFQRIRDKLEQQFPVLAGVRYEQSWGGAMGMSRDLTPFVEFDRESATGWIGGFFGNGVAATNLGARAMADLVLGRSTELTDMDLLVCRDRLPWQDYRRWEWQPLAWSATAGTLRELRRRDRRETGV